MAAKQPVRVFEIVETLARGFVARVGDEPVGLQQSRGADKLVGIPPERRAGRRAACAQDALVEAVQLLAIRRRLQTLLLGRRRVVDEVGLDRVVLLEELAHVDDEVTDDRQTGQRAQLDRLFQFLQVRDAGEPVLAVDVHRVGAAHAFAAALPERQRIVDRFHPYQRVEQHPVVMVERDVVFLDVRLRILAGVVAVNAEFHQDPGISRSALSEETPRRTRASC